MIAARMTAFLVLLLIPAAAHAQRVYGAVVEEGTGHGIGGADVEVLAEDGSRLGAARTNRTGAFLVRLRRPGPIFIRLSHLGYATVVSDTLHVDAHESVSVELRMARAAIPLEPLVVLGRSDSRGVGGMYERMRRPGVEGHFITREQIDRRPAARATDLVEEIPGVILVPQGFGGALGNLITMRGLGVTEGRAGPVGVAPMTHGVTDRCEPTIYVDGVRLQDQGMTLDSFLRANAIEGVEVYTRGSMAPAPLLAMNACGVVAFWTRDDELGAFDWRRFAAWLGGMVVIFTLAGR